MRKTSSSYFVFAVMIIFTMLLSACQTKEVIKTVEVEKVVQQTVQVEKVVEKTVEVEKVVEKYFKMAGIKNANINSLRHTFGANLLNKGTPLKTLQQIMGHNDLRTTRRYQRESW